MQWDERPDGIAHRPRPLRPLCFFRAVISTSGSALWGPAHPLVLVEATLIGFVAASSDVGDIDFSMPAGTTPWLACTHAVVSCSPCTDGMLMHARQRSTSSGMDHDCCALQGRRERSKGIDPTRLRQSCPTRPGNLLVVWLVRVTVTHNRAGRRCWPRHIMVGPLRPNFVVSLLSSLQQALNPQTSLRFCVVSSFPPCSFCFQS